ncbi:MAG: hypothetical protein AAF307_08460 [Pseudomonadota bacterium]
MGASRHTDQQAQEIYQDLLDRIAHAYTSDDFEAYARMIRVPHEVRSFGPRVEINTRAELRVLFDGLRVSLARRGIKDYVRTCLAAKWVSPTEIIGTHETRMIANNQIVEEPYPVKSVLRHIDGAWWVCSSDNALGTDSDFGTVLAHSNIRPFPRKKRNER